MRHITRPEHLMPTLRRSVSLCLIAVLAIPALPAPARADERTIKCESRNGRYRFCPAETENRARVERQLSNRRCELWRNWGYDRRGVWVDDGCRAEFRIGEDGGMSGKTAAIVGGVAAAAVIAAIVAAKKGDKSEQSKEVPEWAVGSFKGYDDRENVSYEVNIAPNGSVNGWANDDEFSGRWERNELQVRGHVWRVSRSGDDLLLTDSRDKKRQVKLWKTW
jgi:hypothetical protein